MGIEGVGVGIDVTLHGLVVFFSSQISEHIIVRQMPEPRCCSEIMISPVGEKKLFKKMTKD